MHTNEHYDSDVHEFVLEADKENEATEAMNILIHMEG